MFVIELWSKITKFLPYAYVLTYLNQTSHEIIWNMSLNTFYRSFSNYKSTFVAYLVVNTFTFENSSCTWKSSQKLGNTYYIILAVMLLFPLLFACLFKNLYQLPILFYINFTCSKNQQKSVCISYFSKIKKKHCWGASRSFYCCWQNSIHIRIVFELVTAS